MSTLLNLSFSRLSLGWARKSSSSLGSERSREQRAETIAAKRVPSPDYSVLDLTNRCTTPMALKHGVVPKVARQVVELHLGLSEVGSERELTDWLNVLVHLFPKAKHVYWVKKETTSPTPTDNNNNNNNNLKSRSKARRQRMISRMPALQSIDGEPVTNGERQAIGFHKLGGIIQHYEALERDGRSFAAIFDRESTRMVLLLNNNQGFDADVVVEQLRDEFCSNREPNDPRTCLLTDICQLLKEQLLVESTENIAIDVSEDDPLGISQNAASQKRRPRYDYVLKCYKAPPEYPGCETPLQVFSRRIMVDESLEAIMNKLNGRFDGMSK